MANYRITRNIDASVIDYIEAQLTTDSWSGIRVEVDFSEAYKEPIGCIVINADDNPDTRLEVGSNQLMKTFILEFRLFCTGNGQRKDLRDWLVEKITAGIPYYEYSLSTGVETKSVLKGRISVNRIISNRKELINSENLSKYDKYRHIISVNCRVATF
jgi:hypothetical protein